MTGVKLGILGAIASTLGIATVDATGIAEAAQGWPVHVALVVVALGCIAAVAYMATHVALRVERSATVTAQALGRVADEMGKQQATLVAQTEVMREKVRALDALAQEVARTPCIIDGRAERIRAGAAR